MMNDNRIKRASFFWNALFAGTNALQSAVILFAASRRMDISVAGMLTIGFTIGNLAAIVARYGMRNFQVTDVREEYSFSDYFHCRIVTFIGSLAVSVAYLAVLMATGRNSGDKTIIIFGIILLKLLGAIEEVFVGRLQQQGRLDIGARIASVRVLVSTFAIFISIWFISSIFICILLGIAAEVAVDLLMIPKGKKYTSFRIGKIEKSSIKTLLSAGLPLCIGTALHNYIGNGPKYLVDLYFEDGMQAICGYIMMPMFVLSILNLFIMQPAVKGIGDAWNREDKSLFRSKARKHIGILSGLSVAVLIGGYLLGLPVLSWMYDVDLLPYRKEFLLLMAGGGVFTITSYMIVLLTAMRKQKGIVWGCVIAVALYIGLGKLFVQTWGFMGTCLLYIAVNLIMMGVFILFMRGKKTC